MNRGRANTEAGDEGGRIAGAHYIGSRCESYSSEYKTEEMPCEEKPVQHTGTCQKNSIGRGPSDHKAPEASGGLDLASIGSTVTVRIKSLKDFKQLTQAKNMFLYSFKVSNTNKT